MYSQRRYNFSRQMEKRTKDNPWKLMTPPQSSQYEMYVDQKDGQELIVCTVGKTVLLYDYRCLVDCHQMLIEHGDWMLLGSKDEKQPAQEGTVEYWARSPENPIGGWYGLLLAEIPKPFVRVAHHPSLPLAKQRSRPATASRRVSRTLPGCA